MVGVAGVVQKVAMVGIVRVWRWGLAWCWVRGDVVLKVGVAGSDEDSVVVSVREIRGESR